MSFGIRSFDNNQIFIDKNVHDKTNHIFAIKGNENIILKEPKDLSYRSAESF